MIPPKIKTRAQFKVVNMQDNVVFLENTNSGAMSITNDAENVIQYIRSLYGTNSRVVYKDTDGEWWEITFGTAADIFDGLKFKKWYGLAWDILHRGNQ